MGSGKEYGVSHLNSYFSNKKRKKKIKYVQPLMHILKSLVPGNTDSYD